MFKPLPGSATGQNNGYRITMALHRSECTCNERCMKEVSPT